MAAGFEFRLVRRGDLPLLRRWRSAEHVVRWWGQAEDLEGEYITGTDPVQYFIALLAVRWEPSSITTGPTSPPRQR